MQLIGTINKRIKSIESTKRITNAAKLVATAKIQMQRNIFQATSNFCHEYYQIFKKIISYNDDFDVLRNTPIKTDANLHILISSETGLCGGYNNSIYKQLLKILKTNDKIIVFGKKGINYLNNNNFKNQILKMYDLEYKNINFYSLLPLANIIIDSFTNSKFRNVKLIFNKFKTTVKYDVIALNILPLDNDLFSLRTKKSDYDLPIIDSNLKDIFKNAVYFYVCNCIYGGLIESYLCELCARRFAMENATKNADDIIGQLKIIRNKMRQETITQQINEIIASSLGGK